MKTLIIFLVLLVFPLKLEIDGFNLMAIPVGYLLFSGIVGLFRWVDKTNRKIEKDERYDEVDLHIRKAQFKKAVL